MSAASARGGCLKPPFVARETDGSAEDAVELRQATEVEPDGVDEGSGAGAGSRSLRSVDRKNEQGTGGGMGSRLWHGL
jgi:hypothetical protein